MLILTRRVGETIVIGDNVVITVLGIKGNQARIGINAPKDLPVHREEIYQRIQHEKTGQPEGDVVIAAPKEKEVKSPEKAPVATASVPAPAATSTTSVTIKKRRDLKTNPDKA